MGIGSEPHPLECRPGREQPAKPHISPRMGDVAGHPPDRPYPPRMRRALLLWVLIGVLGALVPVAAAQSPAPGGVGVVPADRSPYAKGPTLLIEGVRPGAVLQDQALIVNTSAEDVRVAVYPADGVAAEGGGFGYTNRGEPLQGVGRWLTLAGPQERTVPAGGRVPLSLRVDVARDAFDGRNVGAVVVEPLDQPVTGQFATRTRYAMPVTVVVVGGRPRPPSASPSGPAPAPSPGGAQVVQLRDLRPGAKGGRLCPTVLLGNPGTLTGSARLRVEVDGPLSSDQRKSRSFDVPPPASTRRVALPCTTRPLGPGQLDVLVEGVDDAPDASEDLFWAPWPFYVSLLLLLLIIGALLSTWLRGMLRRRRESAERAAV